MKNSIAMTQLAATLAECVGTQAPAAAGEPFSLVRSMMAERGFSRAEKLLVYNPDAIGMWLYQKYTADFEPVTRLTELAVPVSTVLPSVTPVCFGTMYTGVLPAVHGIERYEKHPLAQESLFDRLAAAEIKTAIVAVADSSMAVLWENAPVDHFILPYDGEVNEKAEALIQAGKYDIVVVYNQEYDDVMHRTHPESPESLAAMHHHIAAFARLASAAKSAWRGHDAVVCWATDHGIHTNDEGHGTHGSDLEDDLNVMHFFGAWRKDET